MNVDKKMFLRGQQILEQNKWHVTKMAKASVMSLEAKDTEYQ